MRAYNNLKLSSKIFISMSIIAIVGLIIGAVGINGITKLNRADGEMYQYNTLPLQHLAEMYDTLASQRICLNNMVIFRNTNPQFALEESIAITEKEELFDQAFDEYYYVLSEEDKSEEQLYNNISKLYYNDFKTCKDNVIAAVAAGDEQAISDAIYAMDAMGAEISGYMDTAFKLNDRLASEKVEANQALYKSSNIFLIASMVVGAVFAVAFSLVLGWIISSPIVRVKNATRQVAETGDFHFRDEVLRAISSDAQNTDEPGQLAAAFITLLDSLKKKTQVLETVAAGDLTADVALAGANDTIGNAIASMLGSLNSMFTEINQISHQVAISSGETASGAQSLAGGASEQAGTIEEISSAVADIVTQSDISAQMSASAVKTGESIRDIALEGNKKMQAMMEAVQEINEASKSIEKVIKSIDDIAFQTNILALNAAVEAAHAGAHGRGFAVVAEEVRNLAEKSAQAANETSVLITANIHKAELGLAISNETAQSLREIIDGIQKTSSMLQSMAEQTANIRTATANVDTAINQVSVVVQQNSATSQQSAAASEEMSIQAQALKDMVAHFRLKEASPTLPQPGDALRLLR